MCCPLVPRRAPRAAIALAVLLAPLAARPAAAGSLLDGALLAPCEPARIDVGSPSAAPWLAAGFHPAEPGRGLAWTSGEARIDLPLAAGGRRSLRLSARSAFSEQRLALRFNGVDLGRRPVGGEWTELAWEVPAGVARPGYNRLELRPERAGRVPPDPRRLAVALGRVEIEPALPCAPGAEAADAAPVSGGSAEIPPGGILLAPVVWPPSAVVTVDASGAPGSRLRLYAWRGHAYRELEAVAAGEGTAERPVGAAAGCCFGAGGLAVVAEGPGGVRLDRLEVSGDEGGWAWRRACRLPWVEAALSVLLAAVLLGGRALLGRHPGLAAHRSRWTPWLDAAAVAALALALRWAFLDLYPEPGRSADAYEYLKRARRLAEGRASFLHDTGWHAWQTWIRPPGYYLFLAGVLGPLGGTAMTAIRLQAVFSALAAGATTWLGGRLFGRVAGLVAGLWLALYVESIVTFSRILSEPLYVLFLLPALGALAAASVRPSWRAAALAGALFGLAALVRSTPVYFVPLAALLLFAIHGRRAAWRPALAMVAALAAVILPWCARNSRIFGAPMGIDDLVVINLLQVSPDHRFVPVRDLDLDTEKGWRTYYTRLQEANRDRRLSRRGGEVLRATLADLARHPRRTLGRFTRHLREFFAPAGDASFFARIHREARRCRTALATDLMNFQYLSMLVLGLAGVALTWRDRRGWPLLAWFFFNVLVINLLFHPEPKYRFPVLPVPMVFAGVAVARLLRARPDRGAPAGGPPRRSPAAGLPAGPPSPQAPQVEP